MADDHRSDMYPMLNDDDPHFDLALRGYDKRQVDDYLTRIEADLVDIQAARDAALAISADRAAHLANREAHIESLKRQSAKAVEPVSNVNISDRIRTMLQLATDESDQIREAAERESVQLRQSAQDAATLTRHAAEEEADRVLTAARSDAEQVRTEAAAQQQRLLGAATQRSAEADQKLAHARVQAATEFDTARTEARRMIDATNHELGQLDMEAAAAREQAAHAAAEAIRIADQDFEIALRSRRAAAAEQARQEAEAIQASNAARIAEAEAQLRTLNAQRQKTCEVLEELASKLAAMLDEAAQK
jgi:DivIVA domain-containing protein